MLVAFNFHGSLSESDVYSLLAEEAGVAEDVAAIADQTRTGDVSLSEGVRQRAWRLEGLPEIEVQRAFDRVDLRPGADELLADLERGGHHVAVVTTAPQRAVQLAFEDSEGAPDTVIGVTLDIEQNALTGEVSGRLLEESKGDVLSELVVEGQFGTDETLAVGSDNNDREMLDVAADSICFDPTPGLERHCEATVTTVDHLRGELEGRNVI